MSYLKIFYVLICLPVTLYALVPVPLVNGPRNNCFMNSVIQCLYQIDPFMELVKGIKTPKTELIVAYQELIKKLNHQNKSKPLNYEYFFEKARASMALGSRQGGTDSLFLQKLLGDVKKNDAVSLENIFGIKSHTYKGMIREDAPVYNESDLMFIVDPMISFEIPGEKTFKNISDYIFKTARYYKRLVQMHDYFIMSFDIPETPIMDIPLQGLSLKEYADRGDKDKSLDARYSLVGIVAGNRWHAVAYVKEDNVWYCCNDEQIDKNKDNEVATLCKEGYFGGFYPSLLFYKKEIITKDQQDLLEHKLVQNNLHNFAESLQQLASKL